MRFLLRVVIGLLLLLTAFPLAATPDPFNWGSQVNAGECDRSGAPVININRRVVNSVDSGEGGNYWAFDDYIQHIQVWAQPDGSYCVVSRFNGHFDGQAGQTSPGPTGVLSGAADGAFEGGYRAIITGTLKANSGWRTHGNVGTFDYQCSIAGVCPGAVSWIDQYFDPGWTFTYEWWGWVYHGGRYGEWINSSDGNSGDIVNA